MRFLFLAALLAAPAPAAAAPTAPADPAFFEALRAADTRMAVIAHRLATANAPLCDRLQPGLGLVVHGLDQYADAQRPAARAAFGFERPVSIEAVVPGGPAAGAGVRPDDALVAVDGVVVPDAGTGVADRDAALDLIERALPAGSVALTLQRGGTTRVVRVQAVPACRSRFELMLGDGFKAGSDGRIVHLGEKFFERFTDEEVAVVIAHELAHTILRHRERLDAARVSRGLLREVGRNGRLFRQTEREADALAVTLLHNAGYDPGAAGRFWRGGGGRLDGGLFRARTHPSARARADESDAVAAELAGRPRPVVPAILAARAQPLR